MWKMQLSGIICFFVYVNLNLQFAHCETYDEYLTSTLPGLCPYSTFCTLNPVKRFKYKNYSPCCNACSCEDDCRTNGKYGNCCPDFPSVSHSQDVHPPAKCSLPYHYGYKKLIYKMSAKNLEYGVYFHHIIFDCPLGYSDHDVVNKCSTVGIQDLRDIAIVSDDRGRAFSNRYCAECNGVHTFTRWDLKLICMEYTNRLTDVYNIQEVTDNRCLVFSSPPTAEIDLKSRCIPFEYGTCNVTGQWEKYDSNIERACVSTTFPYVDYYSTVYKNPYCFLCNTGENVEFDTVCPLYAAEGNKNVGRADFVFIALIYVTHSDEQNQREKTNEAKCQSEEIFDNHFGTCRQLNCPITLTPVNGKCVQLFRPESSLTLSTSIDANFMDETTRNFFNLLTEDFTEKVEQILRQIFFNHGKLKRDCIICSVTMFPKLGNAGAFFTLEFTTNGTCDALSIISSLKKWAYDNAHVSANSNGVLLAFSWNLLYEYFDITQIVSTKSTAKQFREEKGIGDTYHSLFNGGYSALCAVVVELEPMFYCPSVDIPESDYSEIVSSNKSKFHKSDFTAIHNGNVFRTCVDTYFGKTQNSGVAFDAYPTRMSWIAMAIAGLLSLLN